MKILIIGQFDGLPLDQMNAITIKAMDEIELLGHIAVVTLPIVPVKKGDITNEVQKLLHCDGVYLLNNYMFSKEARLLEQLADAFGRTIIYQKPTQKQLPLSALNELFYWIDKECIATKEAETFFENSFVHKLRVKVNQLKGSLK